MKESNDILTLFEALNSHEVFTPPRVARTLLALIPETVWSDPSAKLLDPATKTGVFLREAFFRFFNGLEGVGQYTDEQGQSYDLNDRQERVNHILKNMLYGIATSELTGYVARRTLYGVMRANTDKQISALEAFEQSSNFHKWTEQEKYNFVGRNKFNEYYDHNLFNTPEYEGFEAEGNIFYPADEVQKIVMEEDDYTIEDTYYPFIDSRTKHSKILDIRGGTMHFNVVIANPPYQQSDGGAAASAKPIYQDFMQAAFDMKPDLVVMVTPSRWFSGGKGLDQFRESALKDKRFVEIHDFPQSNKLFPSVEIKGGVNYFLWSAKHNGDCTVHRYDNNAELLSVVRRPLLLDGMDFFIRDNLAAQIVTKIAAKITKTFDHRVSARKPFGIPTEFRGSPKQTGTHTIKLYQNRGIAYAAPADIKKNQNWLPKYKVIAPYAFGNGDYKTNIVKPFVIEPGTACTETYLVFGLFDSEEAANKLIGYMKTKFFHFLLSTIKNTQHGTKKVYQLIPDLSIDRVWTDEQLYAKYDLTQDEIDYIESVIPEAARQGS